MSQICEYCDEEHDVSDSPSSSGSIFSLSRSPSFSSLTATTSRGRAASAGFAALSRQLDSPARRAARFARSPSGRPTPRACRFGAFSLHAALTYGFRPSGPSPPQPRQQLHTTEVRRVRQHRARRIPVLALRAARRGGSGPP